MIEILTLETAHLYGDALADQHRFRYRQFVERDGWAVPHYRKMEYDQFDTPAAVYLLWRDEAARVRGMVRLIPTTEPYMLKELWDFALPGGCMPQSPEIWENTRFAVDRKLPPPQRRMVMSELILASLEFGVQEDISEYLLVSPLWILNGSLAGAGLRYQILSTTERLGPKPVAIASVEVSSSALAASRSALDVHGSVLAAPTPTERLAA